MTRTACLNSIYELAKKDERVVFIGSDLSPNTLQDFKRDFPDRFFMEGVQEQNIIGMAAGLALEGFIPYVNTIATFITRRCYEQVAIDICAHNLPVRLIGNGGGLVYAPLGPTHCAIEDMAIMRALPNMTVVNCGDSQEMKQLMNLTIDYQHPMYIRLGKDSDPIIDHQKQKMGFIGDYRISLFSGFDILIISTGYMTSLAHKVCHMLEENGNKVSIIHVPTIKPLSLGIVYYAKLAIKVIITMEEGIINGGFGSAVIECLSDNNINIPVKRFGLPDSFPHHYGEREDLLETYGLTPNKMAADIIKIYESM